MGSTYNVLTFYCCGKCGGMFMKNIRDESCPICHVAMKVRCVEVWSDAGELKVQESPAPHRTDS
jgi:hypothetical protein